MINPLLIVFCYKEEHPFIYVILLFLGKDVLDKLDGLITWGIIFYVLFDYLTIWEGTVYWLFDYITTCGRTYYS